MSRHGRATEPDDYSIAENKAQRLALFVLGFSAGTVLVLVAAILFGVTQ